MHAQPDGIELRALGPQDHALLCATPPGVFDHDVTPERARAFLADPANLLVVALERGVVCAMATGTVLTHPDKPPQLFVNEVGVRADRQGRGLGRALMAAVLAAARGRGCGCGCGCEQVWVATDADNAAARALYRGAGGSETEGVVLYEWEIDNA